MAEYEAPLRARAKKKHKNIDGVIVPSVTTVLAILAKPALVKWANRLGLQGIDMDRYKDELAVIGTLAHYFIMCRLGDEVPEVDEYTPKQVEASTKCYNKYLDWESRNPVTPLLVEKSLVSEKYQYGGIPDLYALCSQDLLLGDFKTGKGIYPEMVYQVAGYRQLLRENGYPVSKAVILRLGRDDQEGAEERILSEAELDLGFMIFVRCLEIYKLVNKGRI